MTPLPRTGPVERYAQLRAALADKRAFVDALPGVAVLIRLDERGGDDEPAPWAFHGSARLPVDIPSGDEDVFFDQDTSDSLADDDESTLTGPTFRLSIPAARGRATLHVVPRAPDVFLGRSESNDVCVAERSVSKQHARIVAAAGSFALVNLGSQNGVTLNGKRVPKHGRAALASGDVIELGDVAMLFLDAAALFDGLPRLTDG